MRQKNRRKNFNRPSFERLEKRTMLAAVASSAELLPFGDSNDGLRFGSAVDISDDFAIVAGSAAFNTGTSSAFERNRVFVYQRDDMGNSDPTDDQWLEFDELTSPEGLGGWGESVAIDGSRLAVSAVDKVYLFDFDGTSWNLTGSAVPQTSSPLTTRYFGTSIDLSGDTLAVGTPFSSSTDLSEGRVDVFQLDAGAWNLEVSIFESVADVRAIANKVTLDGDTLSFISMPNEGIVAAGFVYARDAAGDWQQELSFVDSANAVNIDINDGGEEIVVSANGVLATWARQTDGSFSQDTVIRTFAGRQFGVLTIDGDLVYNEIAGTERYYLRGTGDWSTSAFASNDSFRADASNVAIDGNTLLFGDRLINNNYGEATFSTLDAVTGNETQLTTVTLPPNFTFATAVNGFYGSSVAIGDDFVAVSEPNRSPSGDSSRVGVITIYTRDDQGTDDNSDDTYTYFGQIEAEAGQDSFGTLVEAQGNELYVRSRDGLFVYQFDGTGFNLTQPLDIGDVRFDGTMHRMAVDGNRIVITNNNTSDNTAADVSILERVGGQWQLVEVLDTSELFSPDIPSPRDVDLSGDRILLSGAFNEGAVVVTRDASGQWVPEFIAGNFGRGTIDGDRLVLASSKVISFYEYDGSSFQLIQSEDNLQRASSTLFDMELQGDKLVTVSSRGNGDSSTLVTSLWGFNGEAWGVSSSYEEVPVDGGFVVDWVGDEVVVGAVFNDGGVGYAFTIENQAPVAETTFFDLEELSPVGTVVGSVNAFDLDFEDQLTYSVNTPEFSIDSEGQIIVVDASILDFNTLQGLAIGYQVSDGSASASSTVQITIKNIPEPAIIGGLSAQTNEDASSVSGTLTISDPDTFEEKFVEGMYLGTFGVFNLEFDGQWTYTPNAAINGLAEGEVFTEEFNLTSIGGTTATFLLEITGLNDLAVFSGSTRAQISEDATAPLTGQIDVVDPDAGESEIIASQQTGNYGVFEIDATGQWSYTADNDAANIIPAGEAFFESFAFTSLDGTRQTFFVDVVGANDSAVITGQATGTIDQDATAPVRGALGVVDPDLGERLFTEQLAPEQGDFGVFERNGGIWSYTVDSDAEPNLNSIDVFEVSSIDGSASVLVTITVVGRNKHFDDFVSTDAGVPVTFNVLDNDQVDGDVVITSTPAESGGDILIGANGNVTFTPSENAGLGGSDSFQLNFEDENGNVAISNVFVTINQIVDDPNVIGTDGNDTLTGSDADNNMVGGTGSDTLIGSAGDDVFVTDAINGDNFGNDRDVIVLGNVDGNDTGNDVVTDFDTNNRNGGENNFDTLQFTFNGIEFSLSTGNDLLAFVRYIETDGDVRTDAIRDGSDLIFVFGRDSNDPNKVTSSIRLENVIGDDGLTSRNLRRNSVDRVGTFELDLFFSGGQTEVGSNANDSLSGGDTDDIIVGGRGSDTLLGGAGNDVLTGDQTNGRKGRNDQDIFEFGDIDLFPIGNDVITDFDTNNFNGGESNFDTLSFRLGGEDFALSTGRAILEFANFIDNDADAETGTLIDGNDIIFVFGRNSQGIISDSIRLKDVVGDDGLRNRNLAEFTRIGESDGIDIFEL